MYHSDAFNNVKMENVSTNFPSTSASIPGPSAPPPADISNLLSTLIKAGVVSASGTPLGAGATAKEEGSKFEPLDLESEASRTYRESILAQPIKLTSAEITRFAYSLFA